MTLFFLIVFSYLCGSIPFGKIIGLYYGIDIQKKGSGNIGFANCLRVLGWRPAFIVLAGDILKGFIPTIIALHRLPLDQAMVVGLTAVLAHIFPVWLKFNGGKGVATGLGVILAINPTVAFAALIVFLVVLLFTKIISLSSLVAMFTLPIIAYFTSPNLAGFYVCLLILGTWAHRSNIKRIFHGTEKRISE